MTANEYDFETIPDSDIHPKKPESQKIEMQEPVGYTPTSAPSSQNPSKIGKSLFGVGAAIAVSLALFAGYKVFQYEKLLNDSEVDIESSESIAFERKPHKSSMQPASRQEYTPEILPQGQKFSSLPRDSIKINEEGSTSHFDSISSSSGYVPVREKSRHDQYNFSSAENTRPEVEESEAANDEWVITQLKSNAIEHGKKILQLEAQVALLQLDLTKQKSESFSAMQAASEAATTILAMREIMRKLNKEVRSLGGKIDANEKNYASLMKKIEPKLGRLEKKVVRSGEKKPTVSNAPLITSSKEIQPRRNMRSYSTVMVNDRAAFVLNIHSNERRVLEVGSRYPDLGRVEGVSRDNDSVFGVTNDGLSWVIRKSGS